MPVHCCVFGCGTNSRKNRGLTFHGFPKHAKLRETWSVKVKWFKPVLPHSKICSLHFDESDFVSPRKVEGITRNRLLVSGAVPSINLPNSTSFVATPSELFGPLACIRPKKAASALVRAGSAAGSNPATKRVSELSAITKELTALPQLIDRTNVIKNSLSTIEAIPQYQSCPCLSGARHSIFSVNIMSQRQIMYFTGFDRKQFECLWVVVTEGSGCTSLKCGKVSSRDQLLLTLIKLRQNIALETLAVSFSIDSQLSSTIFTSWLRFILLALQGLYNPGQNLELVSASKIMKEAKKFQILTDYRSCDNTPLQQKIFHGILYLSKFYQQCQEELAEGAHSFPNTLCGPN